MMKPINNNLLVKPIGDNSTIGTDKLWTDVSWKPEFHVQVANEVIAVPDRLRFDYEPINSKYMDWETEMEIQVGDIAYFNKLSILKAQKVGEYLLVAYKDCYCVKRGDLIIPINGYMLIEPVYEERVSLNSEYIILDCVEEYAQMVAKDITCQTLFRNELKQIPDREELKSQGIIRYLGKPNIRYMDDKWDDNLDVSVGEYVFLVDRTYPKLEPELHTTIGNYYCVQRRYIMGVQM